MTFRPLLVGLFAAACATRPSAPPPTPAATAPPPPAAVPQTDPPTLSLVDAGSKPRARLRYKPQVERAEFVVVETSSRVRIGAGEAKVPDVHGPTLRLTLELTARTEGPGISVRGRIQKVEVVQKSGVSPAITAAVRNDLEPLAGTKLRVTFDDRGLGSRVELDEPPTVNPQLEHLLASLHKTLAALWPPLPAEEVGRGAQWQVGRQVSVAAAQVQENHRYTVTDLSASRVKLTLALEQKGAEQNLSPVGLPAGTRLALKQLVGVGEGKAELVLTSLVQPLELRWSSQGDGTVETPNEPAGKLEISTTEELIVRRAKH